MSMPMARIAVDFSGGEASINTFGARMAAVFLFVTSTISFCTGVLPRWVSFVGFAFSLVLLLVIADFVSINVLLPSWVLLVSSWLLIDNFHEGRQPSSGSAP